VNTGKAYDVIIEIEKGISNIYSRLATLFQRDRDIYNFWNRLGNAEKAYAEVLILAKGSLRSTGELSVDAEEIRQIEDLREIIKEYKKRISRRDITLQDAINFLVQVEKRGVHLLHDRLLDLTGVTTGWSIEAHANLIFPFIKKYGKTRTDMEMLIHLYEEYRTRKRKPDGSLIRGWITSIERKFLYGLIRGEDGQIYMFLPDDIPPGSWNKLSLNIPVAFTSRDFPWGPRAVNIQIL